MLTSALMKCFTPTFGTELAEDKGMLMAVITASGILVVFVILLLLILIFYAYGGIFRSMTESRKKKADPQPAASAGAPAPVQPSPAAAADGEGAIPGEIIAVIAAAVAAMSDCKAYTVKKVTRAAREPGRRSAWAAAGLYENTRPF